MGIFFETSLLNKVKIPIEIFFQNFLWVLFLKTDLEKERNTYRNPFPTNSMGTSPRNIFHKRRKVPIESQRKVFLLVFNLKKE